MNVRPGARLVCTEGGGAINCQNPVPGECSHIGASCLRDSARTKEEAPPERGFEMPHSKE